MDICENPNVLLMSINSRSPKRKAMVNLKVKEGASRSLDSQEEVPLQEDHSEETLIRKYSFTSGSKDPDPLNTQDFCFCYWQFC